MEQEKATAKAANTVAEKGKPRTVTLKNGTEIQVIKCQVKNLGTVMGLLVYVFESINPEGKENVDIASVSQKDVLQLIATSSEGLFDVVAELSTVDRKELDELELDDAIDIVLAVWEVNQNFFLQKVLPKVSGLLGV